MNEQEATEVVKQAYQANDCWWRDINWPGLKNPSRDYHVTATSKTRASVVGEGRDQIFRVASAKAYQDMKDKLSPVRG